VLKKSANYEIVAPLRDLKRELPVSSRPGSGPLKAITIPAVQPPAGCSPRLCFAPKTAKLAWRGLRGVMIQLMKGKAQETVKVPIHNDIANAAFWFKNIIEDKQENGGPGINLDDAGMLKTWLYGEPIDPSPIIDQPINRGFPWLEVQCSRCKPPNDVDPAAIKHPPTTFVHDLASRLRCRRCAKSGGAPLRPCSNLVGSRVTRGVYVAITIIDRRVAIAEPESARPTWKRRPATPTDSDCPPPHSRPEPASQFSSHRSAANFQNLMT